MRRIESAPGGRRALERVEQPPHRGVARLGVGTQADEDRCMDRRRHAANRWVDLRGQAAADRLAQRRDAPPLERALAVQRLEQRDAERELVGASVRVQPVELLRWHVGRRPEHRARVGQVERFEVDVRVGPKPSLRAGPGQTEVEHAGPLVRADDDVVRLEVAMDDLRRMGRGQPASRRDVHPHHVAPPVIAELPLAQRPAGHELHRQVDLPFVLADLVHVDHVRVGDASQRLRLAAQPGGTVVVVVGER